MFDEPTTGLDPETRQGIWKIIRNARKGRAVILTTHSMEEADALASRIGIMANGRMQCIGSQLHLKHRFGNGYELSIGVARIPKNNQTHRQLLDKVHEFVNKNVIDAKTNGTLNVPALVLNTNEESKDAAPTSDSKNADGEVKQDGIAGVQTKESASTQDPWSTMYALPKEGVRVSQIFRVVEENKARLQIQEWGLKAPSLNDVFMRIALASERRALEEEENTAL